MEVKTIKKTQGAVPTYYIDRGETVEEEPMTAVVVVKHENCDRLFNFTYYRRIKTDSEVVVETKYGRKLGVVVGSFLIPTRQLKYFLKANNITELKPVVGIVKTVITKELVVETDD